MPRTFRSSPPPAARRLAAGVLVALALIAALLPAAASTAAGGTRLTAGSPDAQVKRAKLQTAKAGDLAARKAKAKQKAKAQAKAKAKRKNARKKNRKKGKSTEKAGPAPTTVGGYAAMFARVPVSQWGGGDVSISTQLSDGRRLWLYGDTLSINNGFVHSTAIVQNGDELRVSNGGAQVLPNAVSAEPGYKYIYWIETVEALPGNKARIVAAPMALGSGGGFNFHRFSEQSRAAIVKVTDKGDVQFESWEGWVVRPDIGMDGEDAQLVGDDHFTYAHFVHDIQLDNGTWLKTVNQNWTDSIENHKLANGLLRYHDWRPMFSESATRDNPYWGR